MLDKLMTAKTLMDFMEVSRLFTSSQGRLDFSREMVEQDVVLSMDDLWTEEEVVTNSSSAQSIARALKSTDGEDYEVKLVHRLQLLAGSNPGISRTVLSYLSRACV